VQLAGQAAGGVELDDLRAQRALDGADDLSIRGERGVRRGGGGVGLSAPGGLAGLGSGRPAFRCLPGADRLRQLGQALACVGDQRQGAVLAGIEGLDVEPDDRLPRGAEQRPGAGGESCRRVPTARIRSASAASRLAAAVPVTPTAAMLSASSSGRADLPPCVSQTGMPVSAEKRASAALAPE
jgi:hypothetical protein